MNRALVPYRQFHRVTPRLAGSEGSSAFFVALKTLRRFGNNGGGLAIAPERVNSVRWRLH